MKKLNTYFELAEKIVFGPQMQNDGRIMNTNSIRFKSLRIFIGQPQAGQAGMGD